MKHTLYRTLLSLLVLVTLTPLYAKNLEKVSLQLSWKHQFEYAGYYAAKEKGYYKEVGLDVEFKEMSFALKDSVIDDVISGKTTYAIDYSSIIQSYMDGNPVVLVANFFKHSPLVIASQKDIRIPPDLIGKRFMGGKDALKNTSILLMLKKFGIDEKDFTDVAQTFSINEFINKEVDATTIFLTNQAFTLDKLGYEYNIINPEKYGAEFYVDNLFTSKQEVMKHPLRVKNFKEATIRGWQYALENKEEIINLILTKYNTQNKTKAQFEYEAKQIQNLMLTTVYPIGSISLERVKRIAETYMELGLVSKNAQVNFDAFIFDKQSNYLNFTRAQKDYLLTKQRLTFCIDPDWMPFEQLDKSGIYRGLTSDYFAIFQKKLSIDLELVPTRDWMQTLAFAKERKCDILSLAMQTDDRQSYLDFTKPYVNVPLVLATKLDIPFIDQLEHLENKTIGIIEGHAYAQIIEQKYKNLKIVFVDDTNDGLQKVTQGKIFGFVGTLATVAYKFQTDYIGELKVSAKFDEALNLSIAVRNDEPILVTIFNRLIDDVNTVKRQAILNKYISLNYEQHMDYDLMIQVSIAILILFFAIMLWNRSLHKEKKRTQFALDELRIAEKLLEEKNVQLEKISVTDKLTGIYNRAKLDENLLKEISRSKRTEDIFAVIMIDIDHFKEVNDTYGHQIGDEVLIGITNIIKKDIRRIDTFGRWGGEEFLIICPHASKIGALKKAEDIRTAIEANYFPKVGNKTASLGVALYRSEDSVSSLMNRVDIALYEAKKAGRNKVVFEIN